MAQKPIEVFFSYSRGDKPLRDELEQHLSSLKRRGVITSWHDRQIMAGAEWKDEIDHHIQTIVARYSQNKLQNLQNLNAKLDILRYQTLLLVDLNLITLDRYEYIGKMTTDIGNDLGGWIKQQKQYSKPIRLEAGSPL
jgi:competence CoiA-like predicted nuclease